MLLDLGLALAAVLATGSLLAAGYVVFFAVAGLRAKPAARAAEVPQSEPGASGLTRFVVVLPAHNEGAGLLPTLASLERTHYPADLRRVVVVADNCVDDTAAVARAAGAETVATVEVWERNAPEARGKGQALAWAFARLTASASQSEGAWDALVVIDADTLVDPEFFQSMHEAARVACARGQEAFALQGRYEFARHPAQAARAGGGEWFDALTIASKAAENALIYRPRSAMGLVTLLQGNGFAVSRAALARAPFDAGSIVEDAEYALSLARAGVPVVFVERAVVVSRMTTRVSDAAPQRLRWAGGIFALLGRSLPPLVRAAIAGRDWRLAEAALMLVLTSRLVLIYLTVAAVALLPVAWHTGWFAPLAAMLAVSFGLESLYLWMVLRLASDEPVRVRTILCLPVYLGFVGVAQGCAALGLRRGLWHRTVR